MLRGWITFGVDVVCWVAVTAVGLGLLQVGLTVIP